MAKILIVDDEGKMRALLAMALDAEGYEIEEAPDGETAVSYISQNAVDLIISDIRMPGLSGLDVLQKVKESPFPAECIIMTAHADAKSGIEAMRNGAFEYVAKPFEMDHMLLLVKNALERNNLRQEIVHLKSTSNAAWTLDKITGKSKGMQEAIAQARMVASRDTTVLIRGQSGTGKELFARGIHTESGRKTFIPINCAALPENLLESELFGYEKGAFTGANEQRAGLFETAGNGTIFLDEIGDITPSMQVKLLRVLQEKEFTRVGGTQILKTEARIITATNRDLESAVRQGEFREDLFYRLNVFPIVIPPLYKRHNDIIDLVQLFLLKFKHTADISAKALRILNQYNWPGNVRQLENTIERIVIFANGTEIQEDHIPVEIKSNQEKQSSPFLLPPEGINLETVEKEFILQALERADGNKTKAAELLGISRRAMYSKMKTHGIE